MSDIKYSNKEDFEITMTSLKYKNLIIKKMKKKMYTVCTK